ncbi:MAG: hypothetical protein KGJ13_01400 [Patescibacteria group bacterium]|nr:hypothetical protein [Patescibacteria group bacterium]
MDSPKKNGGIWDMGHGKPFLDGPEPSDTLAPRILHCIEDRERRDLRMKMAVFGAMFMGSLSAAVAGFLNFGAQVSQSGFLSFASLWFSDFSAAIANWSDMLSSMVESFPALPAALVLGGVAFAAWSAGKLVSEITLMRMHRLS